VARTINGVEPSRGIRRAPFRVAFAPARHESREGWRLIGPNGVVADTVEVAFSPWRRTVGLIGRQVIEPGTAMLISPCSQVHTIGMRFAIDAVFCDAELCVLAVDTMAPGRVGRPRRGAHACFELPAGAAAAAGIERGTTLRFER
jgi:uncharacterized membrane protein (UPF0127 family)